MKQTNRILSITLEILFPLLCFGSVFFLTQNLLAAGIILGSLCLPIFFLGMADTQRAGILEQHRCTTFRFMRLPALAGT